MAVMKKQTYRAVYSSTISLGAKIHPDLYAVNSSEYRDTEPNLFGLLFFIAHATQIANVVLRSNNCLLLGKSQSVNRITRFSETSDQITNERAFRSAYDVSWKDIPLAWKRFALVPRRRGLVICGCILRTHGTQLGCETRFEESFRASCQTTPKNKQ
jgi:hypothetical protein